MNRYYELMYLPKDGKSLRTIFFTERTSVSFLGYVEWFMKFCDDDNISRYRLVCHETKNGWLAKQNSMKYIVEGANGYYINKHEEANA